MIKKLVNRGDKITRRQLREMKLRFPPYCFVPPRPNEESIENIKEKVDLQLENLQAFNDNQRLIEDELRKELTTRQVYQYFKIRIDKWIKNKTINIFLLRKINNFLRKKD